MSNGVSNEVSTLLAEYPIVLFPVRVETRFVPVGAPTELLVRIYPDTLAVDTHEPLLTEAEWQAGEEHWRMAWDPTPERQREAWSWLVSQATPTRAAWIVRKTIPVNLNTPNRPAEPPIFPNVGDIRPPGWSSPARARILPDRWLVIGYRNGTVRNAVGNPIPDSLALTLDPSAEPTESLPNAGDLPINAAVAWMYDFERAVEAGMALRMPLRSEDAAEGFDRLLVVGVKASLTAEQGSGRLAELLDAHHYSRGLAFVRQETPTNNTSGVSAGFPPSDPGGAASYATERENPLVRPQSDGMLFTSALGIDSGVAAHLAGADRGEQQAARAMNDALWPVTLGYFFEQMMMPILDQKTIAQVRRYFVDHVRGRGSYPAFRAGGSPYGLLPVTSLDRRAAPARPELLCFSLDVDSGYLHIGYDLDEAGVVTGWSEVLEVPEPFERKPWGVGLSFAHITADDGTPDLLVAQLRRDGGVYRCSYRVGHNLGASGEVERWSDLLEVPDSLAEEPYGFAIAVADISGNGIPDDLLVYVLERHAGVDGRAEYRGRYRIGRNLGADGQAESWSDIIEAPEPFGEDPRGVGAALADLTGDGTLDLLVYQLEHEHGSYHCYSSAGYNLGPEGEAERWSDPVEVPDWFGTEPQNLGIAVTDVNGDGQLDLVAFQVEHDVPAPRGFYRVGWGLREGIVERWGDVVEVPGPLGGGPRSAGIALASLTRPDMSAAGPLVSILHTLRDAWRRVVPEVPHINRSKDPDRDLMETLGMDASARQVGVRRALGRDLLLNLYHFLGTSYFGISNWDDWFAQQQGIVDEVLESIGEQAWDEIKRERKWGPWDPRVGGMVFDEYAYRFAPSLVTDTPLSEEDSLPTPPNRPGTYIDWILSSTIDHLRTQSERPDLQENPSLLYLMLRHAMLLEYARVALDLQIEHKLASEIHRREPELIGLTPGALNRPTIWERLDTPIPQLTGSRNLSEYLEHSNQLKAYRDSFRFLNNLPTAELERLFTETLDVCSHRLDAWITSVASKQLQEMRQARPIGSYLGAYGWVEELRPAPAGRYTRQTLADERTAYVQTGSGGHIHAPSLTHASAAAVLRNGYLTRSGADRAQYALDLSSRRVRAARWVLESIRQGQLLAALLGYLVERGLHERSQERYVQPLREAFPLEANKRIDAPSADPSSVATRNVVDGLALREAWPEVPYGAHGLPSDPGPEKDELAAALEVEMKVLDGVLDSVADLLSAESVYQMIRSDTTASAASLDALAEGVRPPDPEIAHAPRGGTALTHRVALLLGTPVTPSPWATPLTPRAQAERHLDAWVGSLLGDPANVKCRVSYIPALANVSEEVTLAELGLRPLDVVSLARGTNPTASGSELDTRIIDRALGRVDPEESNEVRIKYERKEGWDPTVVRTFPEVLEQARAINAVVGGARLMRPEDLLPPEAAGTAQQATWLATDAAERAESARVVLKKAMDDLNKEFSAVKSPPPEGTEPDLSALRAALRQASLFGITGAFPINIHSSGSTLHETLTTQASGVLAELNRRYAQAQAIDLATGADPMRIQAATEVVQAVFGREFLFLPGFKPAVPTDLTPAMAASREILGATDAERDNVVRQWFQQAARTRPPVERWRMLELYSEALGAPNTSAAVVQLPKVDGASWVALPFDSSQDRPSSGRVSVVLQGPARPVATEGWYGLLLDEWTELIPNEKELTAIGFHYDDPGAEPPQALLIAVPPTTQGTWTLDALVHTLHETLDLAKLRAVDGELLGALGQFLPAIYLPMNVPRNRLGDPNTPHATVATDFSAWRLGRLR